MSGCNLVNNDEFALYASACSNPGSVFEAMNNWWGTADVDSIETMIYHHHDDMNSPVVNFSSFTPDAFEFGDPTGVFEALDADLAGEFTLSQNYPNPFNATTIIEFETRFPGLAKLEIYNVRGRRVFTREIELAVPGPRSFSWDGENNSGEAVSSGLYFYRLEVDGRSRSRKMILLK